MSRQSASSRTCIAFGNPRSKQKKQKNSALSQLFEENENQRKHYSSQTIGFPVKSVWRKAVTVAEFLVDPIRSFLLGSKIRKTAAQCALESQR